LGNVPVVPYVLPGSAELASTVQAHMGAWHTVLLAHHGTVSCGPDLETAWLRAEIFEAYCRALVLARQLGPVQQLSCQQILDLQALKPLWEERMKAQRMKDEG